MGLLEIYLIGVLGFGTYGAVSSCGAEKPAEMSTAGCVGGAYVSATPWPVLVPVAGFMILSGGPVHR